MAITTQFLTGFEHGFVDITTTGLGGGLYDAVNAGWSASTSNPRNGSYCAHVVAPAGAICRILKNVTGAPTKVVVRFGVKVTSRPSALAVLGNFNSGALGASQLQMDSTGALRIFVASGAGIGFTSPIDTTNWHLIELQLDTAAKTLDWKLDGIAQTQVTTTATAPTVTSFELGTFIATGPAFTADYDDWIIGTWTNAATDWYGDGKVLAQRAGVDGTHATITSLSPGDAGTAYSGTPTTINTMVDDPPGTLGWTATRSTTDNIALRTATAGAYAEIKPAVTTETGQANEVRAVMSYSGTGTGANLAACDVRNSAGAVTELWGLTGGVGKAYNVTANNFKGGIVTEPAAGWTAAEVNTIRFRFGGCTSADINPIPTVQAMMLEVDWPIAVIGGESWTATPGDTITIGDAIELVTGKTVALSEPLTMADGYARTATYDRAIPDTLTVADILAPAAAANRTLADTISLAGQAVSLAGHSRALTDNPTIADQQSPLATMFRALADTLTVADLVSPVSGGGASHQVPLTDALTLVDQLAQTIAYARTATDALTVADLASPLLGGGAALTLPLADALTLVDALARTAAYNRTTADALAIADQTTSTSATLRALVDAITIADLLSTTTGGGAPLTQALADTIAITDTTGRIVGLAQNPADTLHIIDLPAQQWARHLTPADTLHITDLIVPLYAIRWLGVTVTDHPLALALISHDPASTTILAHHPVANAIVRATRLTATRLNHHPITIITVRARRN